MKGFPNQISDLLKLSQALAIAADLLAIGKPLSNEVYGEALVRGGVAGTGHISRPVEEYLAEQRRKTAANQSHQTAARGLRELFHTLDLLRGGAKSAYLTPAGRAISEARAQSLTPELLQWWRIAIHNMTHDGGDGTTSHPYQVLLRLISKRPGIPRAKCALALEAQDDSDSELARIVALSDKSEPDIVRQIGVSQTNWDNAKKILPSFAEQLGDVIKTREGMFLVKGFVERTPQVSPRSDGTPVESSQYSLKPVDATSIAQAGTVSEFDESQITMDNMPSLMDIQETQRKISNRLKRHNLLVKRFASLLETFAATLYERPYDCLAILPEVCFLIEAKSLDGGHADETACVRLALAQLLYYEAFLTLPDTSPDNLIKIALFEKEISQPHQAWLEKNSVLCVWEVQGGFIASQATQERLADYLGSSIKSS